MKKDITTRKDIEQLVDSFYKKVRMNEKIGPIFNKVAKVDWDSHLPKMYSFWASILFGERSFSGNPMQKHIQLSSQTQMGEAEFSEWLFLFHQTVDELFTGQKAEEAKSRSSNIARVMMHNIQRKSHFTT